MRKKKDMKVTNQLVQLPLFQNENISYIFDFGTKLK